MLSSLNSLNARQAFVNERECLSLWGEMYLHTLSSNSPLYISGRKTPSFLAIKCLDITSKEGNFYTLWGELRYPLVHYNA